MSTSNQIKNQTQSQKISVSKSKEKHKTLKNNFPKTPLNKKTKLTKELAELESFAESESEALLKLIKEKHQKHKEEIKKLEELKKTQLKTEQQKINFLLDQKDATSKAYLMRRVQSAKYKSKFETEKIKNKINKVDETLKKLDLQDKLDELRLKAEAEVNEENQKAKMNSMQLCEMVNRLYRLNPKDEVERAENKRKIEERKNERRKQMETRRIEIFNMNKNQKQDEWEEGEFIFGDGDNFENRNENQNGNEGEGDLGDFDTGYNKTKIKDKMRKILNSPKKNILSSKKFPLIKNTEKHSYKNPIKITAFINNNNKNNSDNEKQNSNNKNKNNFSLKLPSAAGKNTSLNINKNINRYNNNNENLNESEQAENEQSTLHNLRFNKNNFNNNNQNTEIGTDKPRKRPKSAGYQSAFPSENISATNLHAVKNEIIAIKKNGFKLEDIEKFKKKYKNVDISSLMHQAKINCIKKTSKNKNNFGYLNKTGNNNNNNYNNNAEVKDENEEFEKLKEIRRNINIEKRLYNQAKAKLDEQNSEFLGADESENEDIESIDNPEENLESENNEENVNNDENDDLKDQGAENKYNKEEDLINQDNCNNDNDNNNQENENEINDNDEEQKENENNYEDNFNEEYNHADFNAEGCDSNSNFGKATDDDHNEINNQFAFEEEEQNYQNCENPNANFDNELNENAEENNKSISNNNKKQNKVDKKQLSNNKNKNLTEIKSNKQTKIKQSESAEVNEKEQENNLEEINQAYEIKNLNKSENQLEEHQNKSTTENNKKIKNKSSPLLFTETAKKPKPKSKQKKAFENTQENNTLKPSKYKKLEPFNPKKSYIAACLFNNNDLIQAHLLACRDDEAIVKMLNEKDAFGRKGLNYLLLNCNLDMIKLNLLSGIILGDTVDNWNRNVLHYCALVNFKELFEVIVKCVRFEFKEQLEEMKLYLEKVFLKQNEKMKNVQKDYNLTKQAALAMLEFLEKSFIGECLNIEDEQFMKLQEEKRKSELLINYSASEEKKAAIESNGFNKLTPTVITNHIYFEIRKRCKIPLTRLINMTDIDNRLPIHLACIYNNIEIIKILLIHNSPLDVKDQQGKKPIDSTNSEVIIELLVNQQRNISAKLNMKNSDFLGKVLKSATASENILNKNTELKKLIEENKNDFSANLSNSNLKKEFISTNDPIDKILNLDDLKYFSDEKIIKYSNSYENNNYLMLAVIHDRFEVFKYLFRERNLDLKFKNSNGWTVLHFILHHKRFAYLNFIFNIIPENPISETPLNKLAEEKQIEKLFKEGIEKYTIVFNTEQKNMLFKENGGVSNLGQALASMDNLTNNNLHILYIAISLKFSAQKFNLLLFKILLMLFALRQQYLIGTAEAKSLTPLEIILNRKYDKSNCTLLLKSVEKKNKALVMFLANDYKVDNTLKLYLSSNSAAFESISNLNNLNSNNKLINKPKENSIISNNNSNNKSFISNNNNNNNKENKLASQFIKNTILSENPHFTINIYETNKFSENVLHHAVKAKSAFFIDYFIKLDSDRNIIKSMKDSSGKAAQDYDLAKEFTINFTHIWDAAKQNDLNLFEKILANKFYSISEKSLIFKNTPLHVAASNLSDRIVLYIIKSNLGDFDARNSKGLTAFDCAVYTANKNFIRKFKMILNKEICEFVDLENFNNANNNGNNSFNAGNSVLMFNNSVFGNLKISNKKIQEIKEKINKGLELKKISLKDVFLKVDENKNGKLEGYEVESIFTILDIDGLNRDDVLLLTAYLDKNKNGLIEYEELMNVLQN